MKGSAPNSPWMGFHVRPVRNGKPRRASDRRALDPISTNIAPTSTTSSSAQQKSDARNSASPKFPVGERARRQSHARRRAPYSLAGLGCVGAGLDIKEMRNDE